MLITSVYLIGSFILHWRLFTSNDSCAKKKFRDQLWGNGLLRLGGWDLDWFADSRAGAERYISPLCLHNALFLKELGQISGFGACLGMLATGE